MTLGVSEPTSDANPTLSLAQAFDLLLPMLSDRKNWGGYWMEGYESLTLSATNFTPLNGEPNPFEAICTLLSDDDKRLQHKLEDVLGLSGALSVNFNFSSGKSVVFSAREEDIGCSNVGQDPTTLVAEAEIGRSGVRGLSDVRKHGGYGVGGG